jgi:hypothetical protein
MSLCRVFAQRERVGEWPEHLGAHVHLCPGLCPLLAAAHGLNLHPRDGGVLQDDFWTRRFPHVPFENEYNAVRDRTPFWAFWAAGSGCARANPLGVRLVV